MNKLNTTRESRTGKESDAVKRVLVSEASRRDARNFACSGVRTTPLSDAMKERKAVMVEIAAIQKQAAAIRKMMRGQGTLVEHRGLKVLQQKRFQLEAKSGELKRRIATEQLEAACADGSNKPMEVFDQIKIELAQIRDTLRVLVRRVEDLENAA